jgi:type IV pilus assembly protein PilM
MSIFSKVRDNVISIDIGFRNIKIVECEIQKGDFIHIKNYGIAPTPRECIKNGHIKNIDKIAEAIKKVIDENEIKSKSVKIVMSGTHITSRLMMITSLPNQKIEELIYEHVTTFMPAINVETHQIDYKLIESIDKDGMIYHRVFVTAVLKSIIKSYIDIILFLDLKPLNVDIPAYSIDKFFKRNININVMENECNIIIEKTDEAFAVIDFGSETTIVNILRNKKLEFNKAILRGSSNIDENIARVILRKESEAEAIKNKYGLNLSDSFEDSEKTAIMEAMKTVINHIIEQIFRCFEYYYDKCGGPKINKVYIIGGGSNLEGLRKYLSSMLKMPVFPVGLLSIENINLDKRLDKEKINYLINATGVALE